MPYFPSLGTSASTCMRRRCSEPGRAEADAACCLLPPWLARLPAASRPAEHSLPAAVNHSQTGMVPTALPRRSSTELIGVDSWLTVSAAARLAQSLGAADGRAGWGWGAACDENDESSKGVPSRPPKWSSQR